MQHGYGVRLEPTEEQVVKLKDLCDAHFRLRRLGTEIMHETLVKQRSPLSSADLLDAVVSSTGVTGGVSLSVIAKESGLRALETLSSRFFHHLRKYKKLPPPENPRAGNKFCLFANSGVEFRGQGPRRKTASVKIPDIGWVRCSSLPKMEGVFSGLSLFYADGRWLVNITTLEG